MRWLLIAVVLAVAACQDRLSDQELANQVNQVIAYFTSKPACSGTRYEAGQVDDRTVENDRSALIITMTATNVSPHPRAFLDGGCFGGDFQRRLPAPVASGETFQFKLKALFVKKEAGWTLETMLRM